MNNLFEVRYGKKYTGAKSMEPLFKTFKHGPSEYEVGRSATATQLPAYLPFKDEWRCTLEQWPKERSFFPCPWCGSRETTFTFCYDAETGTNTSGGTTTRTYEVYCRKCDRFTLFHKSEDSYPYD